MILAFTTLPGWLCFEESDPSNVTGNTVPTGIEEWIKAAPESATNARGANRIFIAASYKKAPGWRYFYNNNTPGAMRTKDGKVTMVTTKIKGADGKEASAVSAYDKQ